MNAIKLVSMVVGMGVLSCAPFAQTANVSGTPVINAAFPVGLTPRVAVMSGVVSGTTSPSPSLSFPDGCPSTASVPVCTVRTSTTLAKVTTYAVSDSTNRIIFSAGMASGDFMDCVVACNVR